MRSRPRLALVLALAVPAAFLGGACADGGDTPAGAAGSGAGSAGTTGAAGTTGVAGATGVAGTTGAAGSAAAAGTSGGAGTTGGAGSNGVAGASGAAGTTGSSASEGCGVIPDQGLATYVKHDIVINGLDAASTAMYTNRTYYLRLPKNYDVDRKYPLAILAPGCSGSGASPIPLHNVAGSDAIIVGLQMIGNCFKTNGQTSPDTPYFDAVVKQVEATTCVDKSRLYMAGFSSGSWLTNQVGCARAGLIRAQGNATGGLPGNLGTCAGPIAAMLAHDTTDQDNKIAGGMAARDRILAINKCVGTETATYDAGTPSPCVSYTGCPTAYPVVWCATTGKGHSDQVPISTIGFWKFWSSLPAVP